MTPAGAQHAATYVVEQYVPRGTAAEVEPFVTALRDAAAMLTLESEPVRLACSILLPEDDLCLHVLTAASSEAAVRAAAVAGIAAERSTTATAWFAS